MQKKVNLQDLFLLRARGDRLNVTVFLMNGFQMRGIITGYDPFVVVLDTDGCAHPAGGAAGGGGACTVIHKRSHEKQLAYK